MLYHILYEFLYPLNRYWSPLRVLNVFQYITFRTEYGYRHANVPYFTGRGGITPSDNLQPSTIPNPNAGTVVGATTWAPGPSLSSTPGFSCVAGSGGWCPDLRKDELSLRYAIMVKF